MSILVANPCTSNASPKIYIAESVSDIAFIRNGKPGDTVLVKPLDGFQVWSFVESIPDGSVEGVNYIIAKPCGYWVLIGLSSGGRAGIYSVTDYGASGDGEDDETSFFASAVSAVPLGTEIYVPEGTYILHNLNVNRNVGFRLHPGAILLHRANATAPMIRMTVANSVGIHGGTLNGNKANQPEIDSNVGDDVFVLLYSFSNGMVVRDVTFTGFMKAGINDLQSSGNITLERCKFPDGYQPRTATSKLSNFGFIFAAAQANAHPHVRIIDCEFETEGKEANRRRPGGFYIAGSDAISSYVRLTVTGSTFRNLGGVATVDGTLWGAAGFDVYEDVVDAHLSGNFIIEDDGTTPTWHGAKLQNCGNLIFIGNVVRSAGTVGINYTPGERLQANEYRHAIIADNIVEGVAGTVGIGVTAGESGGWREVTVQNNHVTGYAIGMQIEGEDGAAIIKGVGPLLVSGNTIIVDGTAAVNILNTAADIRFIGNHFDCTNAQGVLANDNNATTSLTFIGNKFLNRTAGYVGARIWGVKDLTFTSNIFDCVSECIELKQDGAANLIQRFRWDSNNIVLNGAFDITVADIASGYMTHNGAARAFPNSGSALTWTNAAGTDRILAIDQTNLTVMAGPGTAGGGYCLLATKDQASLANLILARNNTAGGAANIQVASDTAAGGFRAWSLTHADAHVQDKVGIRLETTAAAIALVAENSGQTIDLYSGSTTRTAQFDGSATAGHTRFLVYDVDSGLLQRVKVGANGTGPGGVGRALYIDNV